MPERLYRRQFSTMKMNLLILLSFCISLRNFGQHVAEVTFTSHLNKNSGDSVYIVPGRFPATGIILRIEKGDTIGDTYILAGSDTLHFRTDEENHSEENSYSNLLTFPSPIDTFYFHPGELKKPVNLILINALMPEKEKSTKKKARTVQNRQ